jgi:hypothetical protein
MQISRSNLQCWPDKKRRQIHQSERSTHAMIARARRIDLTVKRASDVGSSMPTQPTRPCVGRVNRRWVKSFPTHHKTSCDLAMICAMQLACVSCVHHKCARRCRSVPNSKMPPGVQHIVAFSRGEGQIPSVSTTCTRTQTVTSRAGTTAPRAPELLDSLADSNTDPADDSLEVDVVRLTP